MLLLDSWPLLLLLEGWFLLLLLEGWLLLSLLLSVEGWSLLLLPSLAAPRPPGLVAGAGPRPVHRLAPRVLGGRDLGVIIVIVTVRTVSCHGIGNDDPLW